jgi:hypothetical protein
MHSRTSVRRGMSLDRSAAISSCVRRDDFLALDFTALPLARFGCDYPAFQSRGARCLYGQLRCALYVPAQRALKGLLRLNNEQPGKPSASVSIIH